MRQFEVGGPRHDALTHVKPRLGRDDGKVGLGVVAGRKARRTNVVARITNHFYLLAKQKTSGLLARRLVDPALLGSVVVAQRIGTDSTVALGENRTPEVAAVRLARTVGFDFAASPVDFNGFGLKGEVLGYGTGLALKVHGAAAGDEGSLAFRGIGDSVTVQYALRHRRKR